MSEKDQNPPATDFEWELSEPVLEAPNPSQCVAEESGFVLIPEHYCPKKVLSEGQIHV